jgi:DNA-binding response OmpR family regulator
MSQTTQPRALILVPCPGLATFYNASLTATGFDVVIAHDADSALTSLKMPMPALIVMDLTLPTMDAIDFIRTVRSQRATAAIPIFILPHCENDRTDAALASGANLLLTHEGGAPQALATHAVAIARSPGRQISIVWPNAADWAPVAHNHVLELQKALHALVRNAQDPAAKRLMTTHAHSLAELLTVALEPGLAEMAAAIETLFNNSHRFAETPNQSVPQTLGRALDFIGLQLSDFKPGTLTTAIGSRVLVVDDEDNVCQLVAAALELAGLSPEIAKTPSAALGAVESERFEVVILDIGLPEMSGFDVCGRLRAYPAHERVPILFLTGMGTFQNRAKSTLSGGNDFITKPFNPTELGLKTLLWIQRHRIEPT